jgi:hypothetical protein
VKVDLYVCVKLFFFSQTKVNADCHCMPDGDVNIMYSSRENLVYTVYL